MTVSSPISLQCNILNQVSRECQEGNKTLWGEIWCLFWFPDFDVYGREFSFSAAESLLEMWFRQECFGSAINSAWESSRADARPGVCGSLFPGRFFSSLVSEIIDAILSLSKHSAAADISSVMIKRCAHRCRCVCIKSCAWCISRGASREFSWSYWWNECCGGREGGVMSYYHQGTNVTFLIFLRCFPANACQSRLSSEGGGGWSAGTSCARGTSSFAAVDYHLSPCFPGLPAHLGSVRTMEIPADLPRQNLQCPETGLSHQQTHWLLWTGKSGNHSPHII